MVFVIRPPPIKILLSIIKQLVGHETSSLLMLYTLMFLSQHPDMVAKIREGIADKPITRDSVDHNSWLSCVLIESLRLLPPIPLLARAVTEEITLGALSNTTFLKNEATYKTAMQSRNKALDVVLPKGSVIIASQMITHKLACVHGRDAHAFRPQRWFEKVKSGEISLQNLEAPGLYPFGLGERNCPGRRFALLEAGFALSMLINEHEFKLAPEVSFPPQVKMHGTLKPLHPIHFQFFSRQQNDGDKDPSFNLKHNHAHAIGTLR